MSPRTLQRHLQEAGSSFQRVLDEARHSMARYYLSNSVLELNEAAYLLGFEDPNSFAAHGNLEFVRHSGLSEAMKISVRVPDCFWEPSWGSELDDRLVLS